MDAHLKPAVLDFQTRKEVTRIKLPPLPPGKVEIHEGGNISHGMAGAADGKTMVYEELSRCF
jgi:hypothetical protein